MSTTSTTFNGPGGAAQNTATGEVDLWIERQYPTGAPISFTPQELATVPANWHIESDWHGV